MAASYRKKLIEVALPLEAINAASAREKSIRHGHPSTLHLWWARRPLAACRAVLFASLVDDPSAHPDRFPTEAAQQGERERLFRLIEQLVRWENSTNETVLAAARAEILRSTGGNPPPVLDPFCGGGSIPLEAQRLGLEAHASDLNPVAVLITKALIEIPPRFAGRPPVNPEARRTITPQGQRRGSDAGASWAGARGLAEDVRYYGRWMRDEAQRRIGHLYPRATLPGGGEATVIAWLWARTVRCPNPACGAQMPLVRSFALSTKQGKETWVEPLVDRAAKRIRFEVRTGPGTPPAGTKGRGATRCLFCGEDNISDAMLRQQAKRHGIGMQLLAVVAEGNRGRMYLAPTPEHEQAPGAAQPPAAEWLEQPMPDNPRWFSPPGYGLTTFADLFTPRQLVALTTFSDLVGEARERVRQDARAAGLPDDGVPLAEGGAGAQAYADAVAVYLALVMSKAAAFHNALARWRPGEGKSAPAFGRQALPMVWDYAEVHPFAGAGGDFYGIVDGAAKTLQSLGGGIPATVTQHDASQGKPDRCRMFVCTDPPYYDNIGYADLSDFFYSWLRKSVGMLFPALFSTMLVPKAQELIANPHRHDGNKDAAKEFFENELARAFSTMRQAQSQEAPTIVFYAFKQAEADWEDGVADESVGAVASTGWETMLEGLVHSGFTITGTWPARTEGGTRLIAMQTNALASSIVLVCRPRAEDAPTATRQQFQRALRRELPEALRHLQQGNIAPVDLAQAAIGPGMAIYSRYSRVLEPDGSPLRVRAALQLINAALDEVLAEQEAEFDPDTRWAIEWFKQFGSREGPFGDAEVLSKAKNTSVAGVEAAGLVVSKAGRVRLRSREELPSDWDPTTDRRLSVWEVTQHLIRALEQAGEAGAAAILNRVQRVSGKSDWGERARDLAYRLYAICEQKHWAAEARAYNSLIVDWPHITARAHELTAGPEGGWSHRLVQAPLVEPAGGEPGGRGRR